MKALTISQPFASMIASGEKWVENRTWQTNYRGPLAIHAGKGTQYLTRRELQNFPTSCIIAVCRLTACISLDDIRKMNELPARRHTGARGTGYYWSELARHKHTEGPWCWVLEDVHPIRHMAVGGQRGLWDIHGDLATALERE